MDTWGKGIPGRGKGKLYRALWTMGRTWALTPREMGAMEGSEQRRTVF